MEITKRYLLDGDDLLDLEEIINKSDNVEEFINTYKLNNLPCTLWVHCYITAVTSFDNFKEIAEKENISYTNYKRYLRNAVPVLKSLCGDELEALAVELCRGNLSISVARSIVNALRRAGIKTKDEILKLSTEELLNIRGVGVNTLVYLSVCLEEIK